MPNRHPLIVNSAIRPATIRSQRPKSDRQPHKWRDERGRTVKADARVSLGTILSNWAALVALWALPYLTLLDHLRPDVARSETLQWSLLVVGALGLVSLLYTSWRETIKPYTDRE